MTGRLLPATPSPSPNACGGFIRGALRWVITRATPGAASAAAVSSAAMRPRAIVEWTSAA